MSKLVRVNSSRAEGTWAKKSNFYFVYSGTEHPLLQFIGIDYKLQSTWEDFLHVNHGSAVSN